MKYITILESENSECKNVGTIKSTFANTRFKNAVEAHFDAKLVSFEFVDKEIKSLTDCIDASPIDVRIKLDTGGDGFDLLVELSQTWIY